MNCTHCGAAVAEGAAYCPSCGRPMAAAGPTSSAAPGTGAAAAPTAIPAVISMNVAAMLAYLLGFISGIIFLLWEPYRRDPLVRFHAWQSIYLSAVWIGIRILFQIFLAITPVVFWTFFGLLAELVSLAFLALVIWMMVQAYKGQRYKLPIIGELAEQRQ